MKAAIVCIVACAVLVLMGLYRFTNTWRNFTSWRDAQHNRWVAWWQTPRD